MRSLYYLALSLTVLLVGCCECQPLYCPGKNDNNNCLDPPYPDATVDAPPVCPAPNLTTLPLDALEHGYAPGDEDFVQLNVPWNGEKMLFSVRATTATLPAGPLAQIEAYTGTQYLCASFLDRDELACSFTLPKPPTLANVPLQVGVKLSVPFGPGTTEVMALEVELISLPLPVQL